MPTRFRLQHLSVVIDDPQRIVADETQRMGAAYSSVRSSLSNEPAALLRIVVGDDPHGGSHGEPIEQVWQGTLDGVAFAVSRRGPRRRIEVPGQGVVDFHVEQGWAALDVAPRADGWGKWFLLFRTICDGLTRGGHCFAHAACLAVERREGWRGVVLTAPSNSGKTTTALALTRSNRWRLLGDDVAYVRPAALGSRVWGLPRACHIRSGTLKLLPWLSELELSPPDAEGVRHLASNQLLGGGGAAWPWLDPTLVIVLDPPNPRGTIVEPLDRAGALNQLAAESLSAIPGVCDEDAGRDFVTFGRLVCTAATCRMSVGPDPCEAAEKLERFLDERDERTSSLGAKREIRRRAA